MIKIAIANRKGGTAKTTTAVHLAAALAEANYDVLLIDTDTQAQCSKCLGVEPDYTLAELFAGEDPGKCLYLARPRLSLLAGSMGLGNVSREIGQRTRRIEYALTEKLKPYEGKFDYVFLDGAPGFSVLSVNVLVYADEILCPVSMEALAVDGFRNFYAEMMTIREDEGTELRYILPTILDGRVRKSEDINKQLRENFNGMVLPPIRYSSNISYAAGWGKTVYEYAPRDQGSLDYAKVAEIIARHE